MTYLYASLLHGHIWHNTCSLHTKLWNSRYREKSDDRSLLRQIRSCDLYPAPEEEDSYRRVVHQHLPAQGLPGLDCTESKQTIPQGELRTQKLKSHLLKTQILRVLPLKPGVGQYIAIHATLHARDFFTANIYPSGPFTCIFPKPLPSLSYVGCG